MIRLLCLIFNHNWPFCDNGLLETKDGHRYICCHCTHIWCRLRDFDTLEDYINSKRKDESFIKTNIPV